MLQPVVAMGSEVHDEAIAGCVAVDSRAQASLLAGAIVDSGARHCRIYLPHRLRRLDRQRLEGLTEALEEARVVTDTAILGSGSLDWEPGIAAVALDAGTLAALAKSYRRKPLCTEWVSAARCWSFWKPAVFAPWRR